MSIIVVCPGCRKSFKVSDKYAGKSGPCPNCKRTLQVPEKSEEVKIHAPTEFAGGGRSVSGKLVIKPEAFKPVRFKPVTTAIIVATVAIVLAVAWAAGRAGLFQNLFITAAGLLVVSPPLAAAAYAVMRDPELEPYRSRELYLRSTLCALAYAALWGIFALLVARGVIFGEIWIWLFVVPPFLVSGGLFAMAAFDLDFGDGLFHYAFYLLATLILRWAAGMSWIWDL